jgi:predicted  nucleic acid-binding Zn-ribbon protein
MSRLKPRYTRIDAETKIEERLKKGAELQARAVATSEEFETLKRDIQSWHDYNRELLEKLFEESDHAETYENEGSPFLGFLGGQQPPLKDRVNDKRKEIADHSRILQSILERLDLSQ